MLDQCLCHLSVGLAGHVPVDDHFFKRRPEDADPLSQSQRDAHRLLQTLLHRSLSPDRQTLGLTLRNINQSKINT